LSGTDIKVIALAYSLLVEKGEHANLRKKPLDPYVLLKM